jgi:hypothetical protein
MLLNIYIFRLPKLEHRIQQAHGRRRRQYYNSSSTNCSNGSFSGSTSSSSEHKASGDTACNSSSYSSNSIAYGDTEVLAMAFVGSRGLLATAGNDGVVRCWCFASRQLAAELSVVSLMYQSVIVLR